MKKICLLVFALLLLAGLRGQVDPYNHLEFLQVSESPNDSVDLARRYIHVWTDEEREFFAIIENFDYDHFDNTSIHYPKADFSKKTDTTYLPLILEEGQVYMHPHDGRVTSRFGPRGRRNHYGTDMKLYTGDTVRSIFDGIVRISLRNPSYGYLVIVRHYNGLETYYAHLSKLLVEPEQPVKAGEAIGLGGNTGRSKGAHLHFEARYLGAPINPEEIIDFDNKCLRCDTLALTPQTFAYTRRVASSGVRYHLVKSGETLSSISRKYKTSVSNLAKLNKISPSTKIRAGASLRVR